MSARQAAAEAAAHVRRGTVGHAAGRRLRLPLRWPSLLLLDAQAAELVLLRLGLGLQRLLLLEP